MARAQGLKPSPQQLKSGTFRQWRTQKSAKGEAKTGKLLNEKNRKTFANIFWFRVAVILKKKIKKVSP